MQEQRALGSILVRHGVTTHEALEPLYEQQKERGAPLLELVVQSSAATDTAVAQALAAECGLGFVEKVEIDKVPTLVATRLPIGYARSHRLLVVQETESRCSSCALTRWTRTASTTCGRRLASRCWRRWPRVRLSSTPFTASTSVKRR